MQVTYDSPVDGMVFWKHLPGGWTTMLATLAGNTPTVTIQDNGPYEADPTDGRIVDPSGPGVQAGGGRGVTGVPTLSPWALGLLALGLALVARVARRRRG